jgi:hypothetical protein
MQDGRLPISDTGLVKAIGLVLLALALLLGAVRCSGTQNGADAQLASLQANAHKTSLAGIRARAVTDSVIRKVDSVTREVTNRIAANRQVEARLLETLAANDSLLRLPPDSTDVLLLRLQLARTTEVARLFRDSTQTLISTVLFSISAHEAERQAWLAERAKAAEAIALERQVSEHLRKQARCKVLGASCPTRVQSGMVGGGLVLLLIALL